jgi:hypothetical protein
MKKLIAGFILFFALLGCNQTTAPANVVLKISKSPLGSVSSQPQALDCSGSTCQVTVPTGSSLELTATANFGYVAKSFNGITCETQNGNKCVVKITNSIAAWVEYEALTTRLVITPPTNGAISSLSSSLIDCGNSKTLCNATVNVGETVILRATPQANFRFLNWTDGCTGTSDCTLRLNTAVTVSAVFAPVTTPPVPPIQPAPTALLTIIAAANGTLTSSPAGITCGQAAVSQCSKSYPQGTTVTLTPQPNAGFRLKAFGNDCSGATCQLTLTTDKTVSAVFEAIPPTTARLEVSVLGQGKVSSSPAGIDCGTTCSSAFNVPTQVTLTAVPASGHRLKSWSGGCTGNAACTVTINAASSVTAVFEPLPPPKVEVQFFNVDDTQTAQVNGRTILTTPLLKDSGRVDISQHFTQSVNSLTMTLEQAVGGYSYGFRVWINNVLVLDDQCGTAGGASCNSGDTTTSTKYFNRLLVRSDGSYTKATLNKAQIITLTNTDINLTASVQGLGGERLHWSGNVPGKGWIDLTGTTTSFTYRPTSAGIHQICVGAFSGAETTDAAFCAVVIVPTLEVRFFNVDDIQKATLNGQEVLFNTIGEDKRVDLSNLVTKDSNELVLENYNSGGPYSFGFQVWWQGRLVLDQSCGVVYGANCGLTSAGIRYSKRIRFGSDGSVSIVNLYTPRHAAMKIGETYWIGAEVWGLAGALKYSYGHPNGQWAVLPNNSITFADSGTYTVCAFADLPGNSPHECATIDVTRADNGFAARAKQWVDARLIYANYPIAGSSGYRADCSGLISFAWQLPTPGAVTGNLKDHAYYVAIDDLASGDALNTEGWGLHAHVMLFVEWVDGSWDANGNRRARFYEENGSLGAVSNVYVLKKLSSSTVEIPVLTPYLDYPTWVAQRKNGT